MERTRELQRERDRARRRARRRGRRARSARRGPGKRATSSERRRPTPRAASSCARHAVDPLLRAAPASRACAGCVCSQRARADRLEQLDRLLLHLGPHVVLGELGPAKSSVRRPAAPRDTRGPPGCVAGTPPGPRPRAAARRTPRVRARAWRRRRSLPCADRARREGRRASRRARLPAPRAGVASERRARVACARCESTGASPATASAATTRRRARRRELRLVAAVGAARAVSAGRLRSTEQAAPRCRRESGATPTPIRPGGARRRAGEHAIAAAARLRRARSSAPLVAAEVEDQPCADEHDARERP